MGERKAVRGSGGCRGHGFGGAEEGAKGSERQVWERIEGTRDLGMQRKGDGLEGRVWGIKEWRQ